MNFDISDPDVIAILRQVPAGNLGNTIAAMQGAVAPPAPRHAAISSQTPPANPSCMQRRANWSDDECIFLLDCFHDNKQLFEGNKNGKELHEKWEALVNHMKSEKPGFDRTLTQVQEKLKALKKKYHEKKQEQGQSGQGGSDFVQGAVFQAMDRCWRLDALTVPEARIDSHGVHYLGNEENDPGFADNQGPDCADLPARSAVTAASAGGFTSPGNRTPLQPANPTNTQGTSQAGNTALAKRHKTNSGKKGLKRFADVSGDENDAGRLIKAKKELLEAKQKQSNVDFQAAVQDFARQQAESQEKNTQVLAQGLQQSSVTIMEGLAKASNGLAQANLVKVLLDAGKTADEALEAAQKFF